MLHIACPPLAIRDWRSKDLDLYRDWLQPGHDWQDLDGPYYHMAVAAEHVDAKIDTLRRQIDTCDWPSPRVCAPIIDATSDMLLGIVSWYWISQETLWPALAIALFDPAYRGKGFGYLALGHWCSYVFGALPQIVSLDIQMLANNHAMMRLAEKLGFQEEGHLRMARMVNYQHCDVISYGILRQEWEIRYPGGFRLSL